jgi:hypothetical protein
MIETLEQIFRSINCVNIFYPIIAPLVFLGVVIFDRKQLEIKLDGVAKFVALLVLVGTIKICIWNGQLLDTSMYNLSMAKFLLVFLEDAYFVMVPFYITNRIENKKIKFAIWLAYSIMFSSGHVYQGLSGVFVTAFYPYFLSNKYAKRTSFGTVMACHFLYDCFIFSLPKINNLLALMR